MINGSFWSFEPLTPIPFLAGLRDLVLARSHKRCPRWKLKLAPDLIAQLQPRPGERRDDFALFKGIALQGEQLTAGDFEYPRRGLWRLRFEIGPDGDGWRYRPRHLRRPTGAGEAEAFALRARLLAELRSGRLDAFNPAAMLGAFCLICGRELVDPASMARRIGPECAGTSSLDPLAVWRPGLIEVGRHARRAARHAAVESDDDSTLTARMT